MLNISKALHIGTVTITLLILFFNCNNPVADDPRTLPDKSRFTMTVLAQGLDEPLEMTVFKNQNVLFVERKGAIKMWDAADNQLKIIGNIHVFSGIEDGLLGVAADPDFDNNHFVYFYYAPAGEKAINRLSRMELRGDTLHTESEKIILEIPTQRQYCCHSAGNLTFDSNGFLWLSVGDNTNAEEIEGHMPVDERPGRELSDVQATSANSHDLRGKILRINVSPDGSYTCPAGNMFSADGLQGRPEIYVMGCRNPYRFSVDPKNGYLYWGDIGPDTQVPAPGEDGTLSFDEINQARKPGYFGWPYFLGNNSPFPDYDFATKKEGKPFDPANPVNNSPNNRGLKALPPAQPAMIWYNDNPSKKFPLVGQGGQSAMAGPVYYSDLFGDSQVKLPAYYDGKLLIYDWVRRWFMAVSLDQDGNYSSMEPFLENIKFSAPVDMKFGPDGAIYILEYGTNWFAKNNDARLVKIEYLRGNRAPVASITTDKSVGGLPLDIAFSANGSFDHDTTDQLEYNWYFPDDNSKVSGMKVNHTFRKAGQFEVQLTVSDEYGAKKVAKTTISAGNEPPQITFQTTANRTFYQNKASIPYQVSFSDKESMMGDSGSYTISFHYIPQGKDLAFYLSQGLSPDEAAHAKGKNLIESNDCKSCHSMTAASVGPAYTAIATRYKNDPKAETFLVEKVQRGGTGNWGTKSMSGHPGLSKEDIQEMISYIRSLGEKSDQLGTKGNLTFDKSKKENTADAYLLYASCRDKGAAGQAPLTTYLQQRWRNPRIEAEDRDSGTVKMGTYTTVQLTFAFEIKHQQWMMYRKIDLTDIKSLRYRYQSEGKGGTIEVHLDQPDGKLIGTVAIPGGVPKDVKTDWKLIAHTIEKTGGEHDVYFVFKNPKAGDAVLFNVDWVEFVM